jgi:hypothetical protein
MGLTLEEANRWRSCPRAGGVFPIYKKEEGWRF